MMRFTNAVLIIAAIHLPAAADSAQEPPPRYVLGETIVIHDYAPPTVLPHPRKNYHRIAPPYSDAAIDRDVWAKAWVLLDIDTDGAVARVKLVKHPGYDLDPIAIAYAMKMRFDPAKDASGHAVPTLLLWSMEWPSYWWLVDRDEPPDRVPYEAVYVRCAGSGPMNLGALHPTYRDCSMPDYARISVEPWVTKAVH